MLLERAIPAGIECDPLLLQRSLPAGVAGQRDALLFECAVPSNGAGRAGSRGDPLLFERSLSAGDSRSDGTDFGPRVGDNSGEPE